MPSIHQDSPGGSWVGEEKPRKRRNGVGGGSSGVPVRSERLNRADNRADNSRSMNTGLHSKEKQPTVLDHAAIFLKHLSAYTYDVTRGAFGKLKTPLSYFLAFYVFLGLLLLLRNLLTSSVYSAFSPICRIPGSSLLSLPMCRPRSDPEQSPPVEFDRLMNVQSRFEAVLEESIGAISLPLDMKRGESSIRDLRQVVRYSALHSKNELVLEFDGFIETARIASYDLQKFNSHVGRGVDNILAMARWTKRSLDDISLREGSRGAIVSFFNDKLLAPFQPLRFTEDALLRHYIQHTQMVEKEILRLITEAHDLLGVLQNLEDRLDVIHGIAVRDDLVAQSSRVEVLSQLWTKVGGNRNKLGKFNSELRLLSQVNTYRQNAIAHVSGMILKLQGMGAELEELRERVGVVDLPGGNRGVPLAVHIENIELGLQRLESGRNEAKELASEERRKMMGGEKRGVKEIDQ